jgi:hypothetical protein
MAFFSLALFTSPVLSEQFSVSGNVEVMRLCLSADKYLSALVDAVYIVDDSINLTNIDDIRKRLVADLEASDLAEEFNLFTFVAGPKVISRFSGDGIALRALAFDLVECVSYACKDRYSTGSHILKAEEMTDQLWVDCAQDYRGKQ